MSSTKLVLGISAALVTAAALLACSNDSSSAVGNNSNPFVPLDSGVTANPNDGGNPDPGSTTDGGCPNKPAGCFCGTPTTQAQFLNRCTTSAALPVNLQFTPATVSNIP